jgi:hypothetical protein
VTPKLFTGSTFKDGAGYRVVDVEDFPDIDPFYRYASTQEFVENAKREPGPFLVCAPRTQRIREIETYDPLQRETGLFRTFAGTAISVGGILEFANAFGLLGRDIQTVISRDGPYRVIWGEPISAWAHEIGSMRIVVALWDWISARNAESLDNFFQWSVPENNKEIGGEYGGVAVDYDPSIFFTNDEISMLGDVSEGSLAGDWLYGVWGKDLRLGDSTQAALWIIRDMLNTHLRGRIETSVEVNGISQRISFQVYASSLIACLWLQLALAIEGNKEYRPCRVCKRWFEISPGVAKKSRVYCSDACRFKAYRDRKAGLK